ncbi:MAG: hypothetical protein IKD22_00285 [Lentisphaeria bacterium]|nr:hypothetical protein [Lentisphaeria bacterium]
MTDIAITPAAAAAPAAAESLDALCELDRAGFFPAPGESVPDFLDRVNAVRSRHEIFEQELAEKGSAEVFEAFTVNSSDRIAPELLQEAWELTDRLYGFKVSHVPGFYLTSKVGLLWGGCMLSDPDEGLSIFLLRGAFRKKRQFLNYKRDELLAHELCHSVRQQLNEPTLEEYFAYQTSDRPLRRYLGNCFISDRDALLFLLPMLLLPAAGFVKAFWLPAFPVWIFWLLAMVYPLFLLWRNHTSRQVVMAAKKALHSLKVKRCDALLFRCTVDELKTLASFRGKPAEFHDFVTSRAANSPRWAVMAQRFIFTDNNLEEQNENS